MNVVAYGIQAANAVAHPLGLKWITRHNRAGTGHWAMDAREPCHCTTARPITRKGCQENKEEDFGGRSGPGGIKFAKRAFTTVSAPLSTNSTMGSIRCGGGAAAPSQHDAQWH